MTITKRGIPEPSDLTADEFREWVELRRRNKRGTLSEANWHRYKQLADILAKRHAWLKLPLDTPGQEQRTWGPPTYTGD